MAVPLVARAGGASLAACGGLACLAASVVLTEVRRTPASMLPDTPHAPAAVRLHGRWRQLPRGVSAIATAGGLLAVDRAQSVRAPHPGSSITALARARGSKPPMIVSIETHGSVSGAWIDRWRLTCKARIRSLVTGPAKGLLAALLLGDRSDLERPVQRHCRKTGTMHLLALSGLHVGVVAVILARVLGWAGWPGAPLTGALLVAFVTLAGSRPPLLRAAQGWALITWGRHSGRQSPPLHRLGVAACALLIMDPAVAHDLGAQLSFVAVAGLLAAMPLARGAAQALVAPAGAVLATAPLAAAAFGQVQPWGILLTPLLMPFVGGILTLGVCCVLTGPLTAAFDPITGRLLQWLCNGFFATEAQLAAWVPEPIQPPALPMPPLLVSLAIVAALNVLSRELSGAARRETHGDSAP
jgi:ComEC/Rec2-related protein